MMSGHRPWRLTLSALLVCSALAALPSAAAGDAISDFYQGKTVSLYIDFPPERGTALRKAFMATMADEAFLADMQKHNLNTEPLSGDDLQSIVARAVAAPRDLVGRLNRYIRP